MRFSGGLPPSFAFYAIIKTFLKTSFFYLFAAAFSKITFISCGLPFQQQFSLTKLRLFLNILSLKRFLCVWSMRFAQNFTKLLKNLVSINIAMRNIEWLLLRCLSMARGHQSEIQFMKVRVIFSIQNLIFSIQLAQNRHLSPIVTHKA